MPPSKVSRVATADAKSSTHIPPSRSPTSRFPSGEIIATALASPAELSSLPCRSRQTYCHLLRSLGRDRSGELIALEDALNTLVTIDPRKAHVVSCAFSVGSTSRK